MVYSTKNSEFEVILQYVQYYYMFIYSSFIYKLTAFLKRLYEKANKTLSTNIFINIINKHAISLRFKKNIPPMQINKVIRGFWDLEEIIQLINKLFGFHILLLSINIVTVTLQVFDNFVIDGKNFSHNKEKFVLDFLEALVLLVSKKSTTKKQED